MKYINQYGTIFYYNSYKNDHKVGLPAIINGIELFYKFNGGLHKMNGCAYKYGFNYPVKQYHLFEREININIGRLII